VYVESDLLFALAKDTDWLKADARAAVDAEEVHTSIVAYTEYLQYFYDPDAAEYTVPVTTVIPNMLEKVPVRPAEHEQALLAAVAFISDENLTPADAVHAGIAHTEGETVLSTEQDYDLVGVDRVDLEGYADREE
jgi:predicted nucleic acid-binding protein